MLLSLLLVLFVAAYAVRGYRRGFVVEVVELAGVLLAAVVAWATWPTVTSVAEGWAAAAGASGVFLLVLAGALAIARRTGQHTRRLPPPGRVADGVSGSLFATTWSVLLASGLLVLGVSVPGARVRVARPICEAPVARAMISTANPLHAGADRLARFGRPLVLWLNEHVTDGGLTLSHGDRSFCEDLPDPSGRIQESGGVFTFPPVAARQLSVDEEAERAILDLLNRARQEAGLPALAVDEPLREVGRAHAADMYVRGYFAHETPECRSGQGAEAPGCTDPFARMQAAGIVYEAAGENLALAPTPEAAHEGLMDSPGHRANILNPEFTRVGIGVQAGPYGLMVTQEFAG